MYKHTSGTRASVDAWILTKTPPAVACRCQTEAT